VRCGPDRLYQSFAGGYRGLGWAISTIVDMHPLTATTAAVGLLVAGGAAGVALFERPDPAAPTAARPAPVEVRTEVIHRTVHVVRHIRPKHRVAAPPAPAAVQGAAPVVARAPAPRTTRPLRTQSSATGASHGDDGEHEGGDDD
jgi:hypothetical protein